MVGDCYHLSHVAKIGHFHVDLLMSKPWRGWNGCNGDFGDFRAEAGFFVGN